MYQFFGLCLRNFCILPQNQTKTAEEAKQQILKGKQLAGSSAKQRAKKASEENSSTAHEDKYAKAAALDII